MRFCFPQDQVLFIGIMLRCGGQCLLALCCSVTVAAMFMVAVEGRRAVAKK